MVQWEGLKIPTGPPLTVVGSLLVPTFVCEMESVFVNPQRRTEMHLGLLYQGRVLLTELIIGKIG